MILSPSVFRSKMKGLHLESSPFQKSPYFWHLGGRGLGLVPGFRDPFRSDVTSALFCLGVGVCLRWARGVSPETRSIPIHRVKDGMPNGFITVHFEPGHAPSRNVRSRGRGGTRAAELLPKGSWSYRK